VENYGRAASVLPDAYASREEDAVAMSATRSLAVRPARRRIRLPRGIRACLFDLDGVLTQTASLHAAAWKATFDRFLRADAEWGGGTFVPFSPADYEQYVDGRPRQEGVRTFLRTRGIEPDEPTVEGLADCKNELVHELMESDGVAPYGGSIEFVRAARAAGLRRAVVSASANCADVLAAAGIADLFEVRVDGAYARDAGLHGKPAPDTFLAAAGALNVFPEEAAVFEDALAGVAAGRAGGFGLVVGVDRHGKPDALCAAGADLVVADLAELLEPE
jgi:beta-phosphoglucomutase family hydrolase